MYNIYYIYTNTIPGESTSLRPPLVIHGIRLVAHNSHVNYFLSIQLHKILHVRRTLQRKQN